MAMKKMMSSKMTKTTAKPTASKTTSRTVVKTTTKAQKVRTLPEVTVTAKRKPTTTAATKKPSTENRVFLIGDPRKGPQKQVDQSTYYKSKEIEGRGKSFFRPEQAGNDSTYKVGSSSYKYIPMKKKS